MNIFNPQPHSAAALSQLAEEGKKIEQMRRRNEIAKSQIISNIESSVKSQKIIQDNMAVALFELVKIQNETNNIIQAQCDELKRQNNLLQEQNLNQAKDLKKQKKWNIIAYCITTVIAVVSVVGTFLSVFLR